MNPFNRVGMILMWIAHHVGATQTQREDAERAERHGGGSADLLRRASMSADEKQAFYDSLIKKES